MTPETSARLDEFIASLPPMPDALRRKLGLLLWPQEDGPPARDSGPAT